MASREEIQRIAGAMNALRPDWRTTSLTTFLTDRCSSRSYRALSIAAAAIATDPRCATPNLLAQDGPWWAGAFQASGERAFSQRPSDPAWPFCETPGHPRVRPGTQCARCETEALTDNKALPESAPVVILDEAQAARNTAGAALVLAKLDEARDRAGTGAGEAADPDSSEATAGVTRSVDYPVAPAQARPVTHHPAPGHPTDAPTVSEGNER